MFAITSTRSLVKLQECVVFFRRTTTGVINCHHYHTFRRPLCSKKKCPVFILKNTFTHDKTSDFVLRYISGLSCDSNRIPHLHMIPDHESLTIKSVSRGSLKTFFTFNFTGAETGRTNFISAPSSLVTFSRVAFAEGREYLNFTIVESCSIVRNCFIVVSLQVSLFKI